MLPFLRASLLAITTAAAAAPAQVAETDTLALGNKTMPAGDDIDLDAVMQAASASTNPGAALAISVGVPLVIGIDPHSKQAYALYRDPSGKVTSDEETNLLAWLNSNSALKEFVLNKVQNVDPNSTFTQSSVLDDRFAAVVVAKPPEQPQLSRTGQASSTMSDMQLEGYNRALERELELKRELITQLRPRPEAPPTRGNQSTEDFSRAVEEHKWEITEQANRFNEIINWKATEAQDDINNRTSMYYGRIETPTESAVREVSEAIDLEIGYINEETSYIIRDLNGRFAVDPETNKSKLYSQAELQTRINIDDLDDWLKVSGDKAQVLIDGNPKDVDVLKKHIVAFKEADYLAKAQQITQAGDGKTQVVISGGAPIDWKNRLNGVQPAASDRAIIEINIQSITDQLVMVDQDIAGLNLTDSQKAILKGTTSRFETLQREFADREAAATARGTEIIAAGEKRWVASQVARSRAEQGRRYIDESVLAIEGPLADREYSALRDYLNSNNSLGGKATGAIEDGVHKGVEEVGRGVIDGFGKLGEKAGNKIRKIISGEDN